MTASDEALAALRRKLWILTYDTHNIDCSLEDGGGGTCDCPIGDEISAAVIAYGRVVAIAELEAAVELGDGGCLCGAVDPYYVCAGHRRIAELRVEAE